MTPTVKLYDPYRIVDPTKDWNPVAIQGRTAGGRFTSPSILNTMTDDTLPIDSNGWRSYAHGAWNRLGRAMGGRYFGATEAILPNNIIDNFSWRMICEMVEAAANAMEDTDPWDRTPENAAKAAHKYLAETQYKIARAHLSTLLQPEGVDENAIMSGWFQENWDLIPEVEF